MNQQELEQWVLEGRTVIVMCRMAHRRMAFETLGDRLLHLGSAVMHAQGLVRCQNAKFIFTTPENIDRVRGYRSDGVILMSDVPRPEPLVMCSLLRFGASFRDDVKTLEF